MLSSPCNYVFLFILYFSANRVGEIFSALIIAQIFDDCFTSQLHLLTSRRGLSSNADARKRSAAMIYVDLLRHFDGRSSSPF